MDASKYKRPGIQTPRQNTNRTFGFTPSHVANDSFVRPARPVVSRMPQASPVQPVQSVPHPVRQPVAPQIQPIAPTVAAPPVQKFQSATPRPVAPRRRVAPIDMSLPGAESPERFVALHKAKMRALRRWMFRTTAVAMVLLITFGGLLFSQAYTKAHKVFKGTTGTAAALKTEVTPDLLDGEGDGRINILLLGRGGGTHDAPDLTDTMMVASIDPVNHTSTLISVPRDLWVQVPAGGKMKINGAWETGEFNYLHKVAPGSIDPKAIQAGFETADTVVENVLGIKINYNLIVNFQAFQQAVDTVNGVNVDVPTDLVDGTMAWENGNNPLLAKAGYQQFDGKHALIYVRSRETTSDFARSQRQRSVMLALKEKIVSLGVLSNPVKISGLMNAFGNNVSTDLSLKNANRLYTIVKGIPDSKVTSVGLGDAGNQLVTTANIGGQSTVQPKAGQFNFSEIQNYVHAKIQDPYIMKENAKIMVYNGTDVPGLASQMSTTLKGYGYNVIGSANTPTSGWTTTTLIDLTHKNKFTKNYLEKRLGTTAATSLTDTTIPTNGADFVIIVTSNEATTAQN